MTNENIHEKELRDRLPSAAHVGVDMVEQSDIYVDYTHWIDNVNDRDWKFTFTYYTETGQWDSPIDIKYQDSPLGECYEESDRHGDVEKWF